MAAGSVMSEPNSGNTSSARKYSPVLRGRGKQAATPETAARTSRSKGRVAAMTITANTNMGSVNCRLSR